MSINRRPSIFALSFFVWVCTLAGEVAHAQALSQFLPPLPASALPSPQAKNAPASVDKTVLNGPVVLKWDVEGDVQRLTIQYTQPFAADKREAALKAARAAQRDLPLSCLKQCKAAPMSPPQFDKDGLLRFDLAVRGLPRRLTESDVKDLAQGTPLARLAAEKQAVVSNPTGTVPSTAVGGQTQ